MGSEYKVCMVQGAGVEVLDLTCLGMASLSFLTDFYI